MRGGPPKVMTPNNTYVHTFSANSRLRFLRTHPRSLETVQKAYKNIIHTSQNVNCFLDRQKLSINLMFEKHYDQSFHFFVSCYSESLDLYVNSIQYHSSTFQMIPVMFRLTEF